MIRFVLLAAVALAAIPAPAERLTLEQCLDLAVRNNPGFAAASASSESYRHELRGAFGEFLPSVSASLGYRHTGTGPSESSYTFGGQVYTSSSSGREFDTWSLSLRASQTIWDGGRTFASYGRARSQLRSSEQRVKQARAELVLSVKQAYYELLRAKMQLELSVGQVSRSEEQLRLTEARFELEAATRADVLRVRVLMAEDQLAEVRAVHAVSQAEYALKSLIGIPMDASLEVEDELGAPAFAMTREQVVEEALSASPLLVSARADAEASRHSVGSARSAYLPSWTADAGWSWTGERFSQVDQAFERDYSWYVGSTVTLYLLDVPSRASIGSAKAAARSAVYNVDEVERSVRLEAERAYQSFLEAQAAYELSRVSAEAASEDVSAVEERYRLGAASLLELLDSRVTYTRAKQSAIKAAYDLNLAAASLEKVMGRDGR